mgnify:CR=1 FL=1
MGGGGKSPWAKFNCIAHMASTVTLTSTILLSIAMLIITLTMTSKRCRLSSLDKAFI